MLADLIASHPIEAHLLEALTSFSNTHQRHSYSRWRHRLMELSTNRDAASPEKRGKRKAAAAPASSKPTSPVKKKSRATVKKTTLGVLKNSVRSKKGESSSAAAKEKEQLASSSSSPELSSRKSTRSQTKPVVLNDSESVSEQDDESEQDELGSDLEDQTTPRANKKVGHVEQREQSPPKSPIASAALFKKMIQVQENTSPATTPRKQVVFDNSTREGAESFIEKFRMARELRLAKEEPDHVVVDLSRQYTNSTLKTHLFRSRIRESPIAPSLPKVKTIARYIFLKK